MTKWLGVSKQPTNRPVLFQTGSWEQQRHCLVSSASSTRCLPASSQQPCLMVCAAPCWTAVLISACVTHLLLVTLRCARLWAERDRGKRASCPSVLVYKLGRTLASRPARCEWRGRSKGLVIHDVHLCGCCLKSSVLEARCYASCVGCRQGVLHIKRCTMC